MNIDNVRLDLFAPCSIGIRWDVNGPSNNYLFFVERSEAPEGPWTVLNPKGMDLAYGFIDRDANRDSIDRNLYYRVRCLDRVTSAEIISNTAPTAERAGTVIGNAIAYQEQILLNRFNGSECMVLIRRTFGKRCPVCYDSTRGKSIDDHCPSCFGTTFEGGYYKPIKMRINFNPRDKNQQKNELQVVENTVISAWAGNFPILSPGDLVIEIERNNDRYKIMPPVKNTEHGGAIVHQNLLLNKLHISAPEQKIVQPPDLRDIDDVNVYRQEWVR